MAAGSALIAESFLPTNNVIEPGDGKLKAVTTFVSQKGEAPDIRKQNYRESLDWYAAITADMFAKMAATPPQKSSLAGGQSEWAGSLVREAVRCRGR